MINLLVGSPGHGKTQFMISKILELIKDNEKLENDGKEPRQIFCDINELMIPEIEPAPDDWRTAPDGSIIIYDEVHMRKAYEYKGNVYSQDQMIKDLTIHRHTNKDIWLITQDPQRIEKGIHKLIDRMYYIKRPASKPKYTNVFEFDKWLSNPEAAANRNAKHKKYLDFYRFNFDDKFQKLYKSATDHTSIKFALPKQLLTYVGIVVAIIAVIAVLLLNTNTFNTKRFEEQNAKNHSTDNKAQPSDKTSVAASPVANTNQNLDVECRKGVNVEKPECVKWFNDLTKSGGSVGQSNTLQVSYNPDQPFKTDQIQEQIQYEVTAKPVLSGCMTNSDGLYTAYTQQGTKLKVSQSDCKKIMAGDRPFNYFKQNQNQGASNGLSVQNNNSTTGQQVTQQTTTQNQMSAEDLAKFQQAKQEGLI